MSYETFYRNELEIKHFHQKHRSSVLNTDAHTMSETQSTDYLGRNNRQIWKPVHAMILFMGMKK